MSLATIVVVEDEPAIRAGVVAALRAGGYEPIEAADGEAGLSQARRDGVHMVLLDLMLPKMDGMIVLKEIRKTHPTLPVIILTARGGENDRVAGLKLGADDYVVKPFSARELVARVEAVLRRSPERPQIVSRLTFGTGEADLERRELKNGTTRASLSEMENAILSHLAANPGRAISREELLTRVWGLPGGGVETRTIDMHIARLRAKLDEISGEQGREYIVTVRGKGYMLGDGVRAAASEGRS